MLDVMTLAATTGLLLYGSYAAYFLVPREHPFEAIALNVLCISAGLIGAAPWVSFLPPVPWPGDVLLISMFVVVTIWRREAALFVRCRFGAEPPPHPMRRSSDYVPFDDRPIAR